jgi:glycosyltransferase involved in cell wall biosynthesis
MSYEKPDCKKVYIELSSAYYAKQVTGIQRVVREILYCLMSQESCTYEFIPVVYSNKKAKYRVLGRHDLERIKAGKEGIRVQRSEYLSTDMFESDSLFLDIDASWNNKLLREDLYPKLREKNIEIVVLHYDLVPLLRQDVVRPETVERFSRHFDACVRHASLFLCISAHVERTLLEFVREKYSKRIHTKVIQIGTTFTRLNKVTFTRLTLQKFKRKKYILSVGTIEPRKQQAMILDAFDACKNLDPDVQLVFVGRKGWADGGFEKKIRSHELYNKRVFWYQSLDDTGLHFLYKHAWLTMYLSEYEGFGMPVVEALSYGIPTIVNDNSPMAEVNQGLVSVVRSNDFTSLTEMLVSYLTEKHYHKVNQDTISRIYKPVKWQTTIDDIVAALQNLK